MSIEAMKQALEWIASVSATNAEYQETACAALRAAIEQPGVKTYSGGTPNYTIPIERQWIGLTLDELPDHEFGNRDFILGARWAEAKLKEKNDAG
jgi:hypothetical protein